MKPTSLTLRAGRGALQQIRTHGFDAAAIGTIAGASGGAKWLVLSQLDRVILADLAPKLREPVHLIGTSIGAWRFACYAQSDPLAAIERFERSYIEQTYSDNPDIHEITSKTRAVMKTVLGRNGAQEILENPLFRSHVMAVRSRRMTSSENRWLLGAGLIVAASMNIVNRKTLGCFFERALFFDRRERPPFFSAEGFPIQHVELSEANLADAIIATGSIPLVLSGVADIAGARKGIYRDGGIIDYHHDLQHSDDDRLTLFPHFYDYLVPGWFDKRLTWRRPQPQHTERTVVISPSADFVSRLPNAKIPDRQDFVKLTPEERVLAWRGCVSQCQALADELHEIIEKDQWGARLQPLA